MLCSKSFEIMFKIFEFGFSYNRREILPIFILTTGHSRTNKGGHMAEELKAGCARPTGGPVGEPSPEQEPENATEKTEKTEVTSMIQVGRKAPDFTAPGYQNGKFINVSLSDYIGKWVVLCFYPGDFTFV